LFIKPGFSLSQLCFLITNGLFTLGNVAVFLRKLLLKLLTGGLNQRRGQ
jgi:hypothetical protein